jgi:hypothetical protein
MGVLLLAVACGGAAEDGASGEAPPEAPISVAPRPAPPGAIGAPPNQPAASDADGMPGEIDRLVNDPPERIDLGQFDALLGYYCLDCHATPPCEDACDGFFFDNGADLIAGGNHSPADAESMLQRVVERMADSSMPPASAFLTRPLPDGPRQLMIDFIDDVLNGER